MRINKLLSNYGYCSRKEANNIINDKRVIVNGKLCIKGQWVEESDDILLDNKPLVKKEKVYIALNKPRGITCTAANDVKDNIIDYLNYKDYVFPVGRLDKESEGLILLTNDGDLANMIIESEYGHEKEYIVVVDKDITEDFILNMANGVDIKDAVTKPCKIYKLNDNTFRIILTQGLNRQIRKMCKALRYNVIKLQRVRILNILLDNIPYGEWRNLSKDEVDKLKDICNAK